MHSHAALHQHCLRLRVCGSQAPSATGMYGVAHTSNCGVHIGCTSGGRGECVSLPLHSLILSFSASLNFCASLPASATGSIAIDQKQRAGHQLARSHIVTRLRTPVPRAAYFFGLGIFSAPQLTRTTNLATCKAASCGLSWRPGSGRRFCLVES